jgi:hypothetical protein
MNKNQLMQKLRAIHTNLSVETEFSMKIAKMQIGDIIQMLMEEEDDSDSSDRVQPSALL